jgi:Lon protease-like protein
MPPIPAGEFLLPIFPLPNVVFFPQTRLPLHIFEPRYRQLVREALETDERMGIVLLKPGWEPAYFGAPPVFSHATLGTIEHAIPLDDGRYNILLRGDVRVEILEEVSRVPYRTARVIARPEKSGPAEEALVHREWLADLAKQYIAYLPDQTEVPEIGSAALEPLTNALIMSLALDAEERQSLLEMDSLFERAERVGEQLETRIESLRFLAPYRRDGNPGMN